MSEPLSTISWQGARPTVLGFIDSATLTSGSSSSAWPKLSGGSGWRKKASVSPSSRSWCGSRPMPQATRSTVPNRLVSTGIEEPSTFSNSTAGTLVGEQAGVDLGDLEHGRHGLAHADQGAAGLEMGHELA